MTAKTNAERQAAWRGRKRDGVTVQHDLPVTGPLRQVAIDPWDPRHCLTQREREWVEAAQHFLGDAAPGADHGFRFVPSES